MLWEYSSQMTIGCSAETLSYVYVCPFNQEAMPSTMWVSEDNYMRHDYLPPVGGLRDASSDIMIILTLTLSLVSWEDGVYAPVLVVCDTMVEWRAAVCQRQRLRPCSITDQRAAEADTNPVDSIQRNRYL